MRVIVDSEVRAGIPAPPAHRPPAECAVADQVQEGHEDHHREDQHLHQPEDPELVEVDRPGVEEDDLDVEDDEDHRHQVEADREAGGRLDPRDDAALVGCDLRRGRPLARRQQGGGDEGDGGEHGAEGGEQEDGDVLVHCVAVLPRRPFTWHIEDPWREEHRRDVHRRAPTPGGPTIWTWPTPRTPSRRARPTPGPPPRRRHRAPGTRRRSASTTAWSTTCWWSAGAPAGPPAPTGWPTPAGTWWWSRRSTSPGRRPAGTG